MTRIAHRESSTANVNNRYRVFAFLKV